jgi:hypothetical protein
MVVTQADKVGANRSPNFNHRSALVTQPRMTQALDSLKLLWNGLKFCIEKPIPKPNLEKTFQCFKNDIRLCHFWSTRAMSDNLDNYNPKLYIKSNWTPDEASPELEVAMQNFWTQIATAVADNTQRQRRSHNIPANTRKLLQTLPNDNNFIILPTDKNLGPAIMERETYKRRCLSDHLSDKHTYLRLTEAQARAQLLRAEAQFKTLIDTYQHCLTASEKTYFQRCFGEH